MSKCAEKILVDAVPCGCGPEAISLLSEEVGILIPGNHYTSKDSPFKCTVLCHACDTPGNQTCLILLCGCCLKDKLVCTSETINFHFFVWLTAIA